MASGVYQTKEYKESRLKNREKIIEIANGLWAIEKTLKLPLFGKKKILETRGNLSKSELKLFKELAKKYFYGLVAPIFIRYNEDDFIELEYKKVSNYTILINLMRDKEEIWKQFEKKSIRWGVKTAEKNGLTFGEAIDSDIPAFYNLYIETAKDGNFTPEREDAIRELAKTDCSRLYIIRKGNEIVAGGVVLFDFENNYAVLDLTSSSENGLQLQAMPFLYWNIILEAKSKGLGNFDLGGYDLEAKKGDKAYNINKFKERFNGEIKEQPVFVTSKKYVYLRKLLKNIRFLKGAYKKE